MSGVPNGIRPESRIGRQDVDWLEIFRRFGDPPLPRAQRSKAPARPGIERLLASCTNGPVTAVKPFQVRTAFWPYPDRGVSPQLENDSRFSGQLAFFHQRLTMRLQ